MFLFARKTKTPISTYTDSYRPPNTMRKTFQEPPMTLVKENKFVTEGLTMPRVENPVNQAHLERMIKQAVQEYSYKSSIDPTAYRPDKYWITRPEETYNPIFVKGDRFATWRTGPYNSASWNRYTTYLPRLPKETEMETLLRERYPPKPDQLNNYEREVVVNMLNSLSRKRLPALQHQHAVPGRRPFQGYYSPCTGRHYCLRGMDYYVDGAPDERRLSQLVEKIVRSIPYCDSRQETTCYAPLHNPPPSSPYTNLKWDTSHFKTTGAQRGSYVIHPEFVSEVCPAPSYW
ncbi:PREDICTED: spermatid-specific manchette-related protein 1 isoform X2 [Crocodylus porosus]|uniref:spermatid-specific manchette-related protein 1 isoform X2 n=1 Tax=Crocodylus porosus TaxID=8502 RepID=UPI000938F9F6|nr:PREDICTED: spermatid-specific manchette-related protein 1 isoform X2 [Crocodylus porosus]